MTKFTWISFIVVMTVMFSSIAMAKPKQGIVINGTVIHACYKKINGQLRVVSDSSQCRPSEIPIDLSTPTQPKTVFITSQTYVGTQIGGITTATGADYQCNALAAKAGLPGTYKAWISDDSSGPATTFSHNMGPYVNTKGDTIANDWIGLTSGALLKPILCDESGNTPTAPNVWTGTDPFGQPVAGQNCGGWSSAGTGIQGLGTMTDSTWTDAPPSADCTVTAHLYCFEQ